MGVRGGKNMATHLKQDRLCVLVADQALYEGLLSAYLPENDRVVRGFRNEQITNPTDAVNVICVNAASAK